MFKKTLLSVAIASSLSLTGCLDTVDPDDPKTQENGTIIGEIGDDGKSEREESVGSSNAEESRVFAVFNPAALLEGDTTAVPIPNDLMWDSAKSDGTIQDLGVSNPLDPATASSYNPVLAAAGDLSGSSTVAPIDIRMSGEVNADTLNGSVFLIALDYASGDPLQGLNISEPPTISPNQPSYSLEHKTLDGVSYVRINPTSPLNPKTRYVVAVTNKITDTEGKPISRNPGTTGYGWLTGSDALANSALAPIRSLINDLWEPMTEAFFAVAVNPAREAGGLSALTNDNIAMSYSFMTSGDEKVLNYVADPKQWFNDQISNFIGLTASKAVTGYYNADTGEDYRPADEEAGREAGANHAASLYGDLDLSGRVDHGDVAAAKAAATALFPLTLSADAQATLGSMEAAFPAVDFANCNGVSPNGANGATYIDCVSKVLASTTYSPFAASLPDTTASVDFSSGTSTPIAAVANAASFIQGSMTMPYYSAPPADIGSPVEGQNKALGTGAPLKYLSWEANDTLAYSINSAFKSLGLQLPQGTDARDTGFEDAAINPITDENWAPISSTVNYVFPFPKAQDADLVTAGTQDIEIPIIAVHPTVRQNPSTAMKTVILGHGLFGDRTSMVGLGGALVATAAANGIDLTALMIDQPLHGVTDANTDFAALKTANERHFGYGETGPGQPPSDISSLLSTAFNGGSGSMFINVESFLTSRDNNRQNALDLISLRRAIGSIDIDGGGADLDGSDVYYNGFSLGTISAQSFVAVANDVTQADASDDIKAAFFSTPGGGISRFFENSPAFGPQILNGLGAGFGFTYDTSSYQTYLNVLQASLDSFDAVNFVGDYVEQNSKVLYFEAVNDTLIPVSQAEESRTMNAAAGDTIYSSSGAQVAAVEYNGSISFLSGAEPLMQESQATALTTAGADQALSRNVIRVQPGQATHSGMCSPTGQAEYVGWQAGVLLSDGLSVSISSNTADNYVQVFDDENPLPALEPTRGCDS